MTLPAAKVISLSEYEILVGLDDGGSVTSSALGGPDEQVVAQADRLLTDLLKSKRGIALVLAASVDPSHARHELARELGLPA
ncbi:MAG TPA: hypothetical protein VGI81_00520 [Tepidisphaeraceae bacterium]|jgi:hypothetical protein